MENKEANKKNKVIYVDGSTNDTHSAICIVQNNKKIIKTFERGFNSYEIELICIVKAIETVEENSIIYSDRLDLVEELNQRKKNRDSIRFKYLFELIKEKNLKIEKISREKNLAGIALEKRLLTLKKENFLLRHPELRLTKEGRHKARKLGIENKYLKI